MSTNKSIGVIELSSVGIGYQIQDEMLKAASVDLLIARTICSGKYLIVVGGLVSDVQAAIATGLEAADEAIIDHLVLPNVHESVFPALGQSVTLGGNHAGALGVIETFSGTSALAAADAAAKAARVTLFRIHVAMALGGKGLVLMTGSVADVRAGVDAAADAVRERGLLVSEVVIPRPQAELFSDYL
ncbi:MAG: BMC domain-containing protein [Pirellulales bacterium]|jgi:microcompartment protein CcmL/EutN|nr:BMC domain-containing protein [Thermoguttaceae bacterium]MDD4786268.1 BMC domain-containing protein [Pirellulales bacterium]MDI9445260.1 BMC domain-containing protein [Planctomycetota bacterium]NLZ00631.1 BMC domain-containing protein [Pirellulaceae bacterium]